MNHRIGERTQIDFPVTIYAVDRGPIEARLENVSFTGAAVRCDACVALERNTRVELWMELRDTRTRERVRVEGFVVRRHNALIGVMFMRDMVWLIRRLRAEIRLSSQRHERDAVNPTPAHLRNS